MDNIDIPAHQLHLKAENSWVGTIKGKDEFNHIAVSRPYKSLSKEHMATLVDGPVTDEALTKMRVKTNLVSAGPPSTKATRWRTAADDVAIKLKSELRWYASITAVDASLLPD
jgi:hypothetical protein